MSIALVDYGAGNLTSVRKALAAIGADVFVPSSPDELIDASGVIVPGVGHFGATRALDDVSLEVAEGSIVAIVGANGAGKTSLIRTLAVPPRPLTQSVSAATASATRGATWVDGAVRTAWGRAAATGAAPAPV